MSKIFETVGTPSLPKPIYSDIQDTYNNIDMETTPSFENKSPASVIQIIKKKALEKTRES